MKVLTNPVPDEAVQIENQIRFLQCRDKILGMQPAQLRVIPAAESLRADDLPGRAADVGPVVWFKKNALYGASKNRGSVLSLYFCLLLAAGCEWPNHHIGFVFEESGNVKLFL